MDLHYGNKSCTVVCMSSRNHVSQQHRFAALSDLPTGCGAADITTCYHIAFGTFSLVYLKDLLPGSTCKKELPVREGLRGLIRLYLLYEASIYLEIQDSGLLSPGFLGPGLRSLIPA